MRPLGSTDPLHTSAGTYTVSDQQTAPATIAKTDKKPLALAGDLYERPVNKVEVAAQTEAPPAVKQPETKSVVLGSDQAILLFNSECSVCRKISGWVIANDDPKNGGKQRIDERPIGQDPEALKAIHPDLDIWKTYETIHVVMPNGEIKTGGEAVAEVLRRLPETAWFTPLFDVSVLGFKPFQSMLNLGYTVLDRLRPAMGCESCGTPVPWWGKPIEWTYKAYKAITG
jgi:predicted DCC family thiol-disulfide oxidoreductase YuxK